MGMRGAGAKNERTGGSPAAGDRMLQKRRPAKAPQGDSKHILHLQLIVDVHVRSDGSGRMAHII